MSRAPTPGVPLCPQELWCATDWRKWAIEIAASCNQGTWNVVELAQAILEFTLADECAKTT